MMSNLGIGCNFDEGGIVLNKRLLRGVAISSVCIISVYFAFFSPSDKSEDLMKTNDKYVLKILKDEGYSNKDLYKIKEIDSTDYTVQKIKLDKDNVKTISGIAFVDFNVIVSDIKKDSLFMYDSDFNLIKSVGKTGNGSLEFISPSDVKFANGKLYVLDYGNQRIQILDKNLSHIKDIKFEKPDEFPEFIYTSMAIDKDENIYLSGETLFTRSIQKIDSNNKSSYIKDNFSGNLYYYNDILYAVNFGQFLVNRSGELSVNTGRNFMLSISKDKLKKEYEFNSPLTPASFCMDEKYTYVMSDSSLCLMRFDRKTGKYIDNIGKYSEKNMQSMARMDAKDGDVYTTNASNDVYIYKKK